MQSVLQQLPALIGVALGALATYAATTLNERARWRRQQSVRWDERRLSTYIEYANALKRVISIAVRRAGERGLTTRDEYVSNQGAGDLSEAEENRTVSWEAVLMLGSNDVVAAGRQWHESVFRLVRIASGLPSRTSWAEAVETSSQARRRFYEAARRDIGAEAGTAPEQFEWQLSRFLREEATHQSRQSRNSAATTGTESPPDRDGT